MMWIYCHFTAMILDLISLLAVAGFWIMYFRMKKDKAEDIKDRQSLLWVGILLTVMCAILVGKTVLYFFPHPNVIY